MEAGKLNKRITLQYKSVVSDGGGGVTESIVSVVPDVWAAIWPVSASQMIKGDSVAGEVSHRIRIRYRADIKRTWIIKYGDRRFDIVGIINPEERNEYFNILCKEAV